MLHKTIIRYKSGIYRITNLINNKFYIGSSVNIYNRYHTHKTKLNKNIHINRHLQNSYNKYGKDNFIFEVIEYCDVKNLAIREQYYIDNLKPEYNKRLEATNNAGLIISEKTRLKISETLKLKNEKLRKLNLPTLNPKNKDKEVSVCSYDLNGNFIKRYESIYDAARQISGNLNSATSISKCCKQKNRYIAYGYQWRFASENFKKINSYFSKKAVIFYNETEEMIFLSVNEAIRYFGKKGLQKSVKKGFYKNYKVQKLAQYKSDKLLESLEEGNQQPI